MKLDRIAITGGAGWLGAYVAAEIERHASVTLLDLAPGDGRPSLDVLDLDAVMAALDGCDGLVHLAGIAGGIDASPKTFFEVNVQGTWNVLHAAFELGIRGAAIASSSAAIGIEHDNLAHPPRYLPVDEAHPRSPIGAYGLSKAVNEDTARSFARRGVTTIACLRPTLVTLPEEIGALDNRAKLEASLPGTEFVDISRAAMAMRMVKSAAEITVIRNGARIADIGGAACREAIGTGVNMLFDGLATSKV